MAGLTCHGWEQNNASAGFKCAQTFQSPEFGDFMECNFVREQCFDFPEPNEINSASCKGLVYKSQQIGSCYSPYHMVHFLRSISYICHTKKDVSNEIIKLPSSDLDGIWHAYIGHHPDYDCIDCQQIRFLGQTFFRIFMNHIIWSIS